MRHADPSHVLLEDADHLGHEARADASDHAALRLWLRLLATTTHIEAEIRRRLRERFGISLARFDYLSQLFRFKGGMKMSELSRCLMVTGGNVTGLTDELEKEGAVVRESSPADRRAWIVRLTPKGRRQFEAMAAEHEAWILELFAGLDAATIRQLHTQLGRLRVQLVENGQTNGDDLAMNATPDLDPALAAGNRRPLAGYEAQHFIWSVEDGVGRITLARPERKNPLTFDSYAELRELFERLRHAPDVHAVVIAGEGGNFCSGGDVHEIIGPLVKLKAPELLMFTRMTGDVVKAMRVCPQTIVAAIDGVCAGAGAILAMASDLRLGTARSKTAFLFNRVGLAGCDMGACAMLPRIIGQGRASELLYTGRSLGGEEAERWGFLNRLVEPEKLEGAAMALARDIVAGPTFANGMTKAMLHQEWAMTIEQAIEAEAQAQAICMLTQDFTRAYEAFAAKQRPVFEGN